MAQPPPKFGMTDEFREKHILADEDFDTTDDNKKKEIAKRRYVYE